MRKDLRKSKLFVSFILVFIAGLIGTILLISASYSKVNTTLAAESDEVKVEVQQDFSDLKTLGCSAKESEFNSKITAPENGKEYIAPGSVNLEASYTYNCGDYESLKYEWYLNDQSDPFATEKTSAYTELPAGEFTITYKVKNEFVTKTSTVKVNVKEPPKPVIVFNPIQSPSKSNGGSIPQGDDIAMVTGCDGNTCYYDLYIPGMTAFFDPSDLEGYTFDWYLFAWGGERTLIYSGIESFSYRIYIQRNGCIWNKYTLTLNFIDPQGNNYSEGSQFSVIDNRSECY